jgi:hypothetical protein
LVDAIGNLESRDALMADCMLELLRCAVELEAQAVDDGDDPEFLEHAKAMFNKEFKALNTDVHFLSLYLHPLCRTLAISPEAGRSRGGRTFLDICKIAVTLVESFKWKEEVAKKLVADLQAYQACEAPFKGGLKDGAQWWKSLSVSAVDHPLKGLAILLFKIVPHTAEVEWSFSGFGVIQSPRRSRLSVENLERNGKLRSHYVGLVQDKAREEGKDPRRRHGHSRVPAQLGLNLEMSARVEEAARALEMEEDRDAEGEDDEETAMMNEIEAAFEALDFGASPDSGHANVEAVGIFSVAHLKNIDALIAPAAMEDDLRALRDGEATWSVDNLLTTLGVT